MPRNKALLLLALCLIFSLSACQPAAPTAAPAPTRMLAPTWTDEARVAATVVQLPTATRAPRATSTPQVTATATPPGLALLKIPPDHPGSSLGQSPDGKWLWAVDSTVIPGEKSGFTYRKTRFARVDGSASWEVRPELNQLGANPQGEIVYYPIFWLPKDPFVYLVAQKCCADVQGIHFVTGYNLIRLNLNTGVVATQVSGLEMHDFAFSPHGIYLADIPRSSQVLRLSRLPDGGTKEITLAKGFRQNGGTIFSPDDRRAVVLSCVLKKADAADCERYALLLFDTEAWRATELVPDVQAALGSLLPGTFTIPRLSWYDATYIHLDFPDSPKIPWSWRIDSKTGHVNRVAQ